MESICDVIVLCRVLQMSLALSLRYGEYLQCDCSVQGFTNVFGLEFAVWGVFAM